MDILKLNDNSMKVMLTAEDMMEYSLDCYTLEYDSDYSVNVLRNILRSAGEKCGFESGDSKFYVQLYASAKGECEIYVRRIDTERTVVAGNSHRGICVYSFDAMTHMLQTCSRLRTAGYTGISSAYKENGSKQYYLLLEERSPLPEEHGGRLCERNTKYYIYEHCKLICDGAVELLGRLV